MKYEFVYKLYYHHVSKTLHSTRSVPDRRMQTVLMKSTIKVAVTYYAYYNGRDK
jgi:hypothetical protein